MNKNYFVKVALPLPFFEEFLYSVPNHLIDKLQIGKRALVPFRNTGYSGVITKIISSNEEILNYSVKDIEDIPDNFQIFTEKELNIVRKLADYYVAPLGLTLYSFIPAGLKWKKEKGIWERFEYETKVYEIIKEKAEKLTEKQKKLLEFIRKLQVPIEEEILEAGFSKNTIQSLVKKGIIKGKYLGFEHKKKENIEFFTPLENSNIKLQNKLYLFSGKTSENRPKEYIKLFNVLLKQQKSIIIVFPNIKSINYFYEEISKYFSKVYTYFEGISQKKLIDTIKTLQKENSILITTFSGMLIPVKNLGLVIVEEEYANSYKTMKTPKMDIRRIAYEIHKEKNIPIIYSGLIPSLESYYLYKKGQIFPIDRNFLKIPKKAKIKIYPYDKEKIFSVLLKNIIIENTLILANKKAYSSFLYCPRCDEELICNNCDVPLKIYKNVNLFLKCEICKDKFEYINTCPKCENPLEEVGTGIEKLEEILKLQYGKNYVSKLEEKTETPIKITTTITNLEYIPKNFKTVINIFPDFTLFTPDYKGRENFFKNIVVPYSKSVENYYLITNQSEEISIKSFLTNKIEEFYKQELETRKLSKLPPYTKIILLTFEKKNLNLEFLQNLFEIWINANNIKNFDYKGILKGYIQKKKNKNIAQVLLVDFKEKQLLKDLYEKARKLGFKMSIDINPISIY